MSPIHVLDRILTIYIGIAALVSILFLFLIARFYERKSGQRSYYELFIIPMALFAAGQVYNAWWANAYVGNGMGDGLWFLAGMAVISLGNFLLNLMTGGRP